MKEAFGHICSGMAVCLFVSASFCLPASRPLCLSPCLSATLYVQASVPQLPSSSMASLLGCEQWARVCSARDLQPNEAAINMRSALLGGFVQAREATEDVMLGTHQIPAGTRIWINVLSLHLDDKYFPNAKV